MRIAVLRAGSLAQVLLIAGVCVNAVNYVIVIGFGDKINRLSQEVSGTIPNFV
jgi:hypothetical protein